MHKMKYAYPIIEKVGLGNMLYPWAQAVIWARQNNVPVIAPDWVQIRFGAWLRWERDKRTYLGQFTNKGYISGIKKLFLLKTLPHIEPDAAQKPSTRQGICVFRRKIGNPDLSPYVEHADFLLNELKRITSPSIIKNLALLPKTFIAAHIRRGDFHIAGQLLQPDQYYLSAIKKACQELGGGGGIPVLIFSDATHDELHFLQHIPNLQIMPKAPALQDLLSLVKASAIIGTNHSTFSYWAAFFAGSDKTSYWSHLKAKPALPSTYPIRFV